MAQTRPLPYDTDAAATHLRRSHKAMKRLIDRLGPITLRRDAGASPYGALARSIVFQQLAGAAASTIYGRACLLGEGGQFPEPAALLELPAERLRAAGLSAGKQAALKDLAQKTLDGVVPTMRALAKMEDAAIVERLIQVRGIGRWTVEMMLIFRLGRPDVWPVGDFAVRKGYGQTFGLDESPTQRELEALGDPFSPYRSAAAWYFWRSLDTQT
ncbi:DNA-3-methyladenine glycosylase family protein [Nannocystis bainbridge]|uniref:DNA-3-methyladenine glycosylase II n=1 Tax=Nannocystis bainbridge TaxID=2995303 RepID=A0ABT5EBZ0_9BACT|nr:DNA-3-methyladenine glycosylase 2 family protein [Nannocystis bainbridge]MDC0722930.1 DNA-3-methyladenine glycosylase 2 family protein [Nannocystis bainbridge]